MGRRRNKVSCDPETFSTADTSFYTMSSDVFRQFQKMRHSRLGISHFLEDEEEYTFGDGDQKI